jgi:putative endonuclease
MFVVYILHSLTTGSYFIGHTNDVARLLLEHNRGKSMFGKINRPFELVYTEKFGTKSEASQREMEIKSYKEGEEFQKLINSAQ